MRIALIDTAQRKDFHQRPSYREGKPFSIALLKIGGMLKGLGHECKLFEDTLPPAGEFDEIWITTLFTYQARESAALAEKAKSRAKVVKVGGIAATLFPEYFERHGVTVHRGLLPEAEGARPDYSLLPVVPSHSVAYTSRGCVRKCSFCMVKTLEPEFIDVPDWEKMLCRGVKKVLFYDNNWLAKPIAALRRDVKKILELEKAGRISKVDFNQGLDARLLTEKKADLLASITVRPYRFAFDDMGEDGHLQRAIKLMTERGATMFSYYALYNFDDTPADFYYRIKEGSRLVEELKIEIAVIPMRYQPILEIRHQRNFTGKNWTIRKRKGAMILMTTAAAGGQISTKGGRGQTPLQEFEYWFGKDSDEFNRRIAYPKIRKWCELKKQNLRLMRLGLRAEEARSAEIQPISQENPTDKTGEEGVTA